MKEYVCLLGDEEIGFKFEIRRIKANSFNDCYQKLGNDEFACGFIMKLSDFKKELKKVKILGR